MNKTIKHVTGNLFCKCIAINVINTFLYECKQCY